MHLARLNPDGQPSERRRSGALTESISLAEQSITEIRTLSYLLHPPFLDEMGLLSGAAVVRRRVCRAQAASRSTSSCPSSSTGCRATPRRRSFASFRSR
jgi:hypothetical protein